MAKTKNSAEELKRLVTELRNLLVSLLRTVLTQKLPRGATLVEITERLTIGLSRSIALNDAYAQVTEVLRAVVVVGFVRRAFDEFARTLEAPVIAKGISVLYVVTAHPNRMLGVWGYRSITNLLNSLSMLERGTLEATTLIRGVLDAFTNWQPAKERKFESHLHLLEETILTLTDNLREVIKQGIVRFATWINVDTDGGSRDFINAHSIRNGGKTARHKVISILLRTVGDLISSAGDRSELREFKNSLALLHFKLTATRAGFGETNSYTSESELRDAFTAVEKLLSELPKTRDNAFTTKVKRYQETIAEAIRFIDSLGIAFFSSHPRFNAKALEHVMKEIWQDLGLGAYPQRENVRKQQLKAILSQPNFFLTAPKAKGHSQLTSWILEVMGSVAEHDKRSGWVEMVLLSETESTVSILELNLLLRIHGLQPRLVPLFETNEGRRLGGKITGELLDFYRSRIIPMVGLSDITRNAGFVGPLTAAAAFAPVLQQYRKRKLKTPVYIGLDSEALRGGYPHLPTDEWIAALVAGFGLTEDMVESVYFTLQGDTVFWNTCHPKVIVRNLPQTVPAAKNGLSLAELRVIRQLEKIATPLFLKFVEEAEFEQLLRFGPAAWPFSVFRSVRPGQRASGTASTEDRVKWSSLRAIGTVHASTLLGISPHLIGLGAALQQKKSSLKRLYGQSVLFTNWIDTLKFLLEQEDVVGFAAFAATESELYKAVVQNHTDLKSALMHITGVEPVIGTDKTASQIRVYLAQLLHNLDGEIRPDSEEAQVLQWGLRALMVLRGSSG